MSPVNDKNIHAIKVICAIVFMETEFMTDDLIRDIKESTDAHSVNREYIHEKFSTVAMDYMYDNYNDNELIAEAQRYYNWTTTPNIYAIKNYIQDVFEQEGWGDKVLDMIADHN
jgi:glutaredoxin-related protein